MLQATRSIVALAAVCALAAIASPAAATGTVEVSGLTGDEMLKLRSGPGTGYRVIVGLPNGAILRNHGCDRIGGTPWCKVSLREVRGLQGYVSGHYLKER
ncbi:SH3 domain-containing protein [Tropicimonas isoalkanivorans]|uniref:SH3 domain-containing protein n=1 Tax=Tropicimonas isoalkanivorans TaxID=441112 RepID=A0A1I1K3Z9_9RHOB|nr:SH3 domain-containing protein [Tropicimonas isoalkanivorans]SFC55231.1 SH3 domain-containing protein [Tropicimonas isoalkanivorans]